MGVLAVLGLVLSQSPAQAKEVTPALEMARQLNKAFVEVAEKVSPSVVVITVTQKRGEAEEEESQLIPDELRKFFRRQLPGNGQRRPQSRQVTGQGSGIIISKDGYILTNRHVVDGADKIKVTLKDKKVFTGTVRGVDADSDVAVIKIEPEGHPLVVMQHPLASRTEVAVKSIAAELVDSVASGLTKAV